MKALRTRPGVIGLAAIAIATAALLAACGTTTPSGPGSAATVTVTPPPATKTVTASPSAGPASPSTGPSGPGQCTTGHLRLSASRQSGAAGTVYYSLDFTNTSSSSCTMYGYPGVAFVTAPGGSIIGAPAGRREISGITPTLITLQPGKTAHALLGVSDVLVSNQCQQSQTSVTTIQVYPPDQYTALSAPFTGTGCTLKSLVVMWVSPVASGT